MRFEGVVDAPRVGTIARIRMQVTECSTCEAFRVAFLHLKGEEYGMDMGVPHSYHPHIIPTLQSSFNLPPTLARTAPKHDIAKQERKVPMW